MSNIAQLKQQARTLEQREQWQSALAVYEEMVKESPEGDDLDVGIWNRIGDLHMRVGQPEEAVNAYERAVQAYADAGLHNNAIALCNKILRVTPGRPAIYLKLGLISAVKGFLADARQHIDQFVERMRAGGQLDAALETLLQQAQAQPEEVEVRRIVAEQLRAHGQGAQALELLRSAHRMLVEGGLTIEAERVWSQIQELDPQATRGTGAAPAEETSRSLTPQAPAGELDLHILHGTGELDEPAATRPPGLDLVSPSAGLEAGAEPGLDEITPLEGFEPHAGATSRTPDDSAAGSYADLEEDSFDLEIRVPGSSDDFGLDDLEDASSDADEAPLPLLSFEPLAPADPEPEITALDEISPADGLLPNFGAEEDGPSRSPAQGVEGLETADYRRAGSPDTDASPSLDRLDFEIDDTGFQDEEDEPEPADDEPFPFLSVPESSPAEELPDWRAQDSFAESELFVSADDDAFGDRADDSFDPASDTPFSLTTGDSPPSDEDASLEMEVEPLPFLDASTGEKDEYPADFSFGMDEPAGSGEPDPAADPLVELEVRLAADPADLDAARALVALARDRGDEHQAQRVLESASQALAEEGRYPAALEIIHELLALSPGDTSLYQRQVELAFRADDPNLLIRAYLALANHLQDSGDPGKVRAVYERVLELDPDNPAARRGLGFPEPGALAVPEADDQYIDLAALIFEDERPGTTTRFVVEAEEPSGDEDRDFAEILARFREQVARNIAPDDAASHYDLGVAFKEMGLYDEAVSEFQIALRAGSDPLATLEMLGESFVAKEQHAVAWRVLDRAARLSGASDAELVGVLYWMGRCDEALGRRDAAAECYERVLAVDIRFRDAAERLRILRSISGSSSL